MHKGHIELLRVARMRAKEYGASVALFTFSNNHLKVLGRDVGSLYTFDERLSIYENLDVNYIIAAEFNDEIRKTKGLDFLRGLVENYDIKGVVCGFDHRCGSDLLDSDGIRNALQSKCKVDIVDQISVNNEKISSTLVRRLLLNNRLDEVNSLLTEPFFVEGTVISGRGVGKTLGFPTANLAVDADKILPIGVYGGHCMVDGVAYKCIINIGNTPTFNIDRIIVEVHLLGFHGDLYGRKLKVSLTKFLRNISKFSCANDLVNQLQQDMENVSND